MQRTWVQVHVQVQVKVQVRVQVQELQVRVQTDTDTDTDTDIVDAERTPPHPFDFRPVESKRVECEIVSRSLRCFHLRSAEMACQILQNIRKDRSRKSIIALCKRVEKAYQNQC